MFSHLGTLANTKRTKDNFAWRSGQAHQNQVGSGSLRTFNRVSFITGQGNAIVVCHQQRFNPVAGLVNILYYEDDGRPVVCARH
jgi:hypothetical protein